MKSLLNQTLSDRIKWPGNRIDLLVIFISLFLDASLFPLPTTITFITVALIRPANSYYIAFVAVAGMVTGAITGYFIGHCLWLLPDGSFTHFARFCFEYIPGFSVTNYQSARHIFSQGIYGILFFTIVVPIPYLFFSITAGAFDLNILILLFATLIFQGFRFFLLGWLIIRYGQGVKDKLRKNFSVMVVILILIGMLIFLVSKVIFGLPIFN